MNYRLTLVPEQLNSLKKLYRQELIKGDFPHVAFAAKVLDCRVTAYNSGAVVFQGQDAKAIYQAAAKHFDLPFETKDEDPSLNISINQDSAGSDEVGTGDYFGPIVVCACYLPKSKIKKITELSVADSKTINDERIRQIGPQLYKLLPNSLLILANSRYNKVNQTKNLNAIKALLHNQAFINLKKKIKTLPTLTVIDQFVPSAKYYEYLQDESEVYENLLFETKAENKYPAVACASIIARYAFLNEMDKLRKKYTFNFPLGAGEKVDTAINEFNERYPDQLANVAKLKFKNTLKSQNLFGKEVD